MITFLGCCLAVIVIIAVLLISLVCGVIVDLFWPILAVVGAYYLIKWLQKESSSGKKE